MAERVAIAFELLLIGTLLVRPGRGARVALLAALAAMVFVLVAASKVRHVGDSAEYVVMSVNLARLSPPSLTPAELVEARMLYPEDPDIRLDNPARRGADGRQDLPHFWFYSLLAAPFVRLAMSIGQHPAIGFAALNVLLLLGVATLLSGRVPTAVTLFVVASPILWWVDKPHTEVLTFSLMTAGLLLLRSSPWWSIVAFGAAATQNPAMAGATLIAIAFAVYRCGWRDARVLTASVTGAMLASLHPLYYYWRLGIWSGLSDSVDRHWPPAHELTTVMFDPNLGIFVHDPFLLVAMAMALAIAIRHRERVRHDGASAAMACILVLIAVSFTQTTNVNSGGTPGPSRYGLWLLPFAVPLLAGLSPESRWMKVMAAASVAWCVWAFAPTLPEQYLRPTPLASDIWKWWPTIDDPLAEIFAERVTGHEPAQAPAATPGCEKVLLIGDGTGATWPTPCTSAPLPVFCQRKDALCYANMSGGAYRFAPAPSTPSWRVDSSRRDPDRLAPVEGMLVVIQTAAFRTKLDIWQDTGWSYTERLTAPTAEPGLREWRWIDQHATVGVESADPVVARLKIIGRAYGKPRRVRLSVDGRSLVTLVVSPTVGEYRSPEFDLGKGRTSIGLESLDGSESPATGDPRRLSVQVFRVELVVSR